MAKAKLTADERRAKEWCDWAQDAKGYRDGIPFTVVWNKSRTWGMCPRVENASGDVVIRAVTGCGYCKHSTALALLLAPLGRTDDEKRQIRRQAGAGVPSVQKAVRLAGWELRTVASGPMFDAYEISPLAPVEESRPVRRSIVKDPPKRGHPYDPQGDEPEAY